MVLERNVQEQKPDDACLLKQYYLRRLSFIYENKLSKSVLLRY